MAPIPDPNITGANHLDLPAERGTYVLILRSRRVSELTIGALGQVQLQPGFYIYVGSARGWGGLRSRVSRHLKASKKPHWHIDYLSRNMPVITVWYAETAAVQEHQWARAMGGGSLAKAVIKGFGASDCRCESHLFYCKTAPAPAEFREQLKASDRLPAVPVIRSVSANEWGY
jgi:Uri superfamily endonuclease